MLRKLSTWSHLEIRKQDKNHITNTGNKTFGRVEQYRYLGTTLTNQNGIHEQTKNRLKLENACRHLVQDISSSSLLSNNIKI
jgi:ribosomal protein S2